MESGDTDPVLGATYAQIGEWSRAFHKTQGMGAWIDAGPCPWPLHLASVAAGSTGNEANIHDGLPRTLADLAAQTSGVELAAALADCNQQIDHLLGAWPDANKIAANAAAALTALRNAQALMTPGDDDRFGHRLIRKEQELSRLLFVASGLDFAIEPVPAVATPGSRVVFRTHIDRPAHDNPAGESGRFAVGLNAPASWQVENTDDGQALLVADDARPSDPYPVHYDPLVCQEAVFATVEFTSHGATARIDVPLTPRLTIVPTVTVRADPDAIIINRAKAGADTSPQFQIALGVHGTANYGGPDHRARVGLETEPGWQARIAERADAISVMLTPPPGQTGAPADGLAEFAITLDGAPAQKLMAADYAHTGPVMRCTPAIVRVRTLHAAFPPDLKLAYVGGGHDKVAGALTSIGLAVDGLDEAAFAAANLADFDTIVIGIFAFGERDDLKARCADLHDWVRSGGNLVTLYHRPWDGWEPDKTPPAFLKIGQPSLRFRVTDEAAQITHLDPRHRLLNWPNQITPADWDGWHKERGLYFASQWDPVYQPLLSMADADEALLEGGLLTASIGKGTHTHTSLILHHQMDHLVPGAFRLMANLVAAGQPAT